jgi:endonuclease/exonuclease/phosphatase family metal-dependent hydrolase
MLPVESVFQRQDRFDLLVQNLKRLKAQYQRQDTLLMVALQELNPVVSRLDSLKKALMFEGAFSRVNHGLKLGMLSYPFFLDEGLACVWSGLLKNVKIEHHLLSGQAWGLRQQSMLPFCFHLSECRGALFVCGEFLGSKYLFVNLHLHHSKAGEGDQRRRKEIAKLLDILEDKKKDFNSIFLMGDFNCETGEESLIPLEKAGYKDLQAGEALYTWDALNNPYAHLEKTMHVEPEMARWSSSPRQLDRLYAWGKMPEIMKIELKFQQHGEICSDHFGLFANLEST